MNPIDEFDRRLRQVSSSKLGADAKYQKMSDVSRAIERYLGRVEAQKYDPAALPAVEAAKNQLRGLADQAHQLAEVYRRASMH